MAITQSDIITRVKVILQDDGKIIVDLSTETELKALISSAVGIFYDKDKPYKKYKSYTGTGTYDYTKPTDWIDGFSQIILIEYPAGEQEPIYLQPEKYMIYNNGTIDKIRFISDSPSASETFILTYIIPHTISSTVCTIYEGDFNAICHLVAGITLLTISNKFTESSEPTISSSAVAWRDRTERCRKAAEEQIKLYAKAMAQDEEVKCALVIREYDSGYPWGGEYLTHPEDWR
jgi:hypothetical protein